MTRWRFAAVAAAWALGLCGCGEEPSAPAPPADPIPLGERPEKACVLVLNTLSETISRLDPATGATRWSLDLGVPGNGGIAPAGDTLVIATYDGTVRAMVASEQR